MTDLELTGLDGTNPLGFLAALGTLDILHRAGRSPSMRWRDDVVPTPIVTGTQDADDLIAVLDADRARWLRSVALNGPRSEHLDDARPKPKVLRSWAAEILATLDESWADADLFAALVSEGAVDRQGNAKPTHLDFTAGQQRLFVMMRTLATEVDADRLREALVGPWRGDSPLPSLSWNAGIERLYAVRATNPATEQRLGVPGADWLAVMGLSFFPTRTVRLRDGTLGLYTSGCDQAWKRSELRWPLWASPLGRDAARSLVGAATLVRGRSAVGEGERLRASGDDKPDLFAAWSVIRVLGAPIKRTDQGGYGSFGGSTVVIEAAQR